MTELSEDSLNRMSRGRHDAAIDGPHSRACGVAAHDHGIACHPNCPTCGGDIGVHPTTNPYLSAGYIANLEAQEAELRRQAENEKFKIWEAGFVAGLRADLGTLATEGHSSNPYQWHGPKG